MVDLGILKGLAILEDKFTPILKMMDSGMERTGGVLENFSKGMKVASLATAPVSLAFTALGGAALAAALKIDEALDLIHHATGATGDDLKGLEESFKNVFKSIPNSAHEVAEAIGQISVRTGLVGEPLEKLTTQVLTLARITHSDLNSILPETIRLFKSWGVDTEHQSETLDFLYRTSQKTGVGVQSLIQRVTETGAVFRSLGLDLEESVALLGKWEKEGVNSEKMLSALQIAARKFAKEGIDLEQGLETVVRRIKELGPGIEANTIAFKTFGRGAAGMVEQIQRGNLDIADFVKALKASEEGIMDSAKATDGFQENLKIFRNQLILALEPLGTRLLRILEQLQPMFLDLMDKVIKLADGFAELPAGVQETIIVLGGLGAVATPLLYTFAKLLDVGVLVGRMFVNLGNTIPVLTARLWLMDAAAKSAWISVGGPVVAIGALIGGIVAGVERLADRWNNVSGAFQKDLWWLMPLIQNLPGLGAAINITPPRGSEHFGGKPLPDLGLEQDPDIFAGFRPTKKRTVTVGGVEIPEGDEGAPGKLVEQWSKAELEILRKLGGIKKGVADLSKEQVQSIEKMSKAFTGAQLADEIKILDLSLRNIGGAEKLTSFESEKLGNHLKEIVVQGGKLTPELQKVFEQHVKLSDIVPQVNKGLDTQALNLRNLWPALERTDDEYINIAKTMKEFNKGLFGPGSQVALPKIPGLSGDDIRKAGEQAQRIAHAFDIGFENFTRGLVDSMGRAFGDILTQTSSFRDSFIRIWQGIARTISDLLGKGISATFSGLLNMVRGGSFAAAFPGLKGAGSFLTSGVGSSIAGAGVGAGVGFGVGNKFGTTAGVLSGVGSGALTGMMLGGPIGAGVGAAAGLIAGVIGGQRNTTAKSREDFAKQLGFADLGSLYKQLQTMERPGDQTRGSQLANIGLNVIGKKDVAGNQQWMKDVENFLKKVQEDTAKIASNFDQLGGALQAFGGRIPASLRPMVDELMNIGGLTEDQKRLLQEWAGEPSWQTIQGLMDTYGIKAEAAGQKFQQAKMDETALKIARDLQTMADAGLNTDLVLEGVSDELSDLAFDAIKTGTTLPKTLEPFMRQLFEAGKLVDDSGNKLEDFGALQFEDKLDPQLKLISDLLKDIRDLLKGDLPKAADDAASGINSAFRRIEQPKIKVGFEFDTSGAPEGWSWNPEPKIQAREGLDFRDYGSHGTDVTLHNWEAVVRPQDLQPGPSAVNQTTVYIDARGALLPDQASALKVARWLVPVIPRVVTEYGEYTEA